MKVNKFIEIRKANKNKNFPSGSLMHALFQKLLMAPSNFIVCAQ